MDGRRSLSKYREILAEFAERIHRGDLPPGARLPTERQLAEQRGVNRSTVVAAYVELQAAGLVERRQGSGTFVRGDLWGLAPDWSRYIMGGAFEPTRPLYQRIRAARATSGVIDLSEGILSEELMPRALIEMMLGSLELPPVLGYPQALGDRRLREVIATQLYDTHGISADPESILITDGSQQAIYLITRALLSPGDAIAIEQPSYYYALSVFQSSGIRLLPVPMDDDGLDPKAIRPLFQRHRIRLVLTNPTYHNPTTTTMPVARREELLAICRTLNIPVVEDDVYGELTIEGTVPPPLKALDRENRVLYLGTLSKTGTPALRLGWIIGPKPVIDRLADVKHQMDFGTNTLVQWLAAELLISPGWNEHLRHLRLALRARRDALIRYLTSLFGSSVSFRRPAGGLHLWVRWDDSVDDRQRLEAAIKAGVVFAPGRLYGMPDGYARVTYGKVSEKDIAEGVRRLGKALKNAGHSLGL